MEDTLSFLFLCATGVYTLCSDFRVFDVCPD